jgi:hypothetical protein
MPFPHKRLGQVERQRHRQRGKNHYTPAAEPHRAITGVVLALNATIGRLRHKWLIPTNPQNKFPKCSGLQANLADRKGH